MGVDGMNRGLLDCLEINGLFESGLILDDSYFA